jgi:hypothetical protein
MNMVNELYPFCLLLVLMFCMVVVLWNLTSDMMMNNFILSDVSSIDRIKISWLRDLLYEYDK